MEYTPIGSVTAVTHPAADRAAANGLPSEVVDGNDVIAVHDAVAQAADRAMGGGVSEPLPVDVPASAERQEVIHGRGRFRARRTAPAISETVNSGAFCPARGSSKSTIRPRLR